MDQLTIPLETIEAYNRRIPSEMQVTRRMTRRQDIVARVAAQAQIEQEAQEAIMRGVQHPL